MFQLGPKHRFRLQKKKRTAPLVQLRSRHIFLVSCFEEKGFAAGVRELILLEWWPLRLLLDAWRASFDPRARPRRQISGRVG